jgi:4-hydroxy-tetrahydrodipicolinate reductase
MGHMLEEIALERGHEVVLKINSANRDALTHDELRTADAVIEFTAPSSAMQNIAFCLDAGVPIIVGTTGWYDQLDEVKKKTLSQNGSLVYASNYSIGVNMVFAMNRILAKWMNAYPEYEVTIEEIHHKQKLDAPSGTALTIAEGILENIDRKKGWGKQEISDTQTAAADMLKVAYGREDGVPGIHRISYTSAIDEIQVSHEAFNRKGFALGAVIAAEFIKDKKGIYTAADIFGFSERE